MKWSFKIGEIFGISIRVHIIFILLLFFVGVSTANEEGMRAGLNAVLFLTAVFCCVLLHELGHCLQAQRYGVKVEDITLLPIGGVAHMHEIPEKPSEEVRITLAGLVVSFGIAGFLLLLLIATGRIGEVGSFSFSGRHFLANLFLVNVIIGLFNIIPAFPMDGGRVFRALLAMKIDYVHATHIAVTVGQGVAILFAVLGFFFNWLLMLIALFIFMGAGSEEQMVRMRALLREIPASRAMTLDFHTLTPEAPMSSVLEYMSHGYQSDFPVVEGDRILGVLTKAKALSAIHEAGLDVRIGSVMDRDFVVSSPEEMLSDIYQKMLASKVGLSPIVDFGKLVGIITLESIGQFFMIASALKGEKPYKMKFPYYR